MACPLCNLYPLTFPLCAKLAHHYIFFGEPGSVLDTSRHGRNQEKGAHSTDKHHCADHNLADGGQFSGKSHGKSAGTVGADHLKQDFQEGGAGFGVTLARGFRVEQDHGGDTHDDHGHHEDSDGLIDCGFGDGSAENLGPFAAKEAVEPQQADHGGGSDLDATAAATRIGANEHDDDKEEQGTGAEAWGIHVVEARRTAGEGHEEGGFQLLGEGEVRQGVAPFGQHEDAYARHYDNQGTEGGDAGMEGDLAEGVHLEVEHVLQFGDGQEAETAGQGQDAGNDVHCRVEPELHQGIGEQGKAHVAEGADRLEDGAENPVVQVRDVKLGEVNHGADAFQNEGKGQYSQENLPGIHVTFLGVVGKKGGLVVETRVHAGQQDEGGRHRHDTKAAQLHEEQQDPVAEIGEGAADVNDGKARHAHGGGGGKEGIQETDGGAD